MIAGEGKVKTNYAGIGISVEANEGYFDESIRFVMKEHDENYIEMTKRVPYGKKTRLEVISIHVNYEVMFQIQKQLSEMYTTASITGLF